MFANTNYQATDLGFSDTFNNCTRNHGFKTAQKILDTPPQPASPLRRSPLRCLPLPTSMPATARTIHMRRDFASVNNRRRNLAVHAIRSPATAQQTSAALPPSRRYPRKARGLFLQDLAKGFARRRRQTASMPAHIPDALTHR